MYAAGVGILCQGRSGEAIQARPFRRSRRSEKQHLHTAIQPSTAHPRMTRAQRGYRWLALKCRAVFRENASPSRTAIGFAVGSFIGVFPSFLIGSPLAYFLASRFGLNKAAAVSGTFLMNPFTAPVFYSISTWVGAGVMGEDYQLIKAEGVIEQLRHFGLAFIVGNTLFALAVAAVGGAVMFWVATGLSQNRLCGSQSGTRSGPLE